MRRGATVLAMLIVGLAAGIAAAQETGLVGKGLKAGLSSYSFGGADSDAIFEEWKACSRMGLAVGGYATFALGPNLALQPELLYVHKGTKYEREWDRWRFSLDYLDLPVLLKYRFATTGATRPNLFTGPVVSTLLSAKMVSYVLGAEQPQSTDISYGVKDLDFGWAIGGGLDFEMAGGSLSFDVRYVLPLTRWSDYVENEDPELSNKGLLVMAGVGF